MDNNIENIQVEAKVYTNQTLLSNEIAKNLSLLMSVFYLCGDVYKLTGEYYAKISQTEPVCIDNTMVSRGIWDKYLE